MSTSIKDGSPKREGQCSLRSTNGIAVFDETYSYIVVATSKTESYANVITTSGLPVIGSLTAGISPSGYGICRSLSATRWDTNPLYWTVTAEFSSEVEENQNNQDPRTDPLVWVPIYETKFERIQEVFTKDVNDKVFANSTGQPFTNGLTISRFIPIWEFFQFESATLSDEQLIERNETVNSATFKGRAAKTLLLTVVSSSIGFYYGRRMRLTKYQLRYNVNTWTKKILDVGTTVKSGSDNLPYTDKAGNVILGSLNGTTGAAQTVGTPPGIIEFEIYRTKAFATFLRL